MRLLNKEHIWRLVMNKYILGIDGMRCGMCELHVEEAISKNINVKKVKANRYKKEVVT